MATEESIFLFFPCLRLLFGTKKTEEGGKMKWDISVTPTWSQHLLIASTAAEQSGMKTN